jgi:hypothetical protein
MAHSLWTRFAIVLFIIGLVPIGETGAAPVTYEFTSGALTGGFTADFGVEFSAPFQSWKITAPTGFGTMVYDSTNPEQSIFANDPPCRCVAVFTGSIPSTDSHFQLFYSDDALPSDHTGTYNFDHLINALHISGSGNWVRGQAVPEPNTLWSCALGLLTLAGVQWLSRAITRRVTFSVCLLIVMIAVLLPFGPALAAPYTYEFTSGALTGTFTADADSGAAEPFISWNITAPTGFGTTVYGSGIPGQPLFENLNWGGRINLTTFSGLTPPIESESFFFNLNVNNLGFSFPDNDSGNYVFEHFINQLSITGEGNWARVPEPNTLWSLVLAFLALGVVKWIRRVRGNPLSSS